MVIDELLYTILTGYAGVSALVDTRVYRHQLPPDATLPAVTFVQVSGVPVQHRSSAAAALFRSRFQFDAWATTHAGARDVAEQVELALATMAGSVYVEEWIYEVDHLGAAVLDHAGAYITAGMQVYSRADVALLANDLDIFEETPHRFRAVVDELIWHTV